MYLVLGFCTFLYSYYGHFLIGSDYRVGSCLEVYYMMANFMKVFLNHVRDGAEAMDVCVQDPLKSDVDLEGAWYV